MKSHLKKQKHRDELPARYAINEKMTVQQLFDEYIRICIPREEECICEILNKIV